MQRLAQPISQWLASPNDVGGPLSSRTTRMLDADTLDVPEGRRGVSVSVLKAPHSSSPVLDTSEGSATLPEGFTAVYACDFDGDSLDAFTVTTADGDDVLVIETWVTP